MKTANDNPDNMTRVLVELQDGIIDFAFYKDGMYEIGKTYYTPDKIKNWVSISEVKKCFFKPETMKTLEDDKFTTIKVGSVKETRCVTVIQHPDDPEMIQLLYLTIEDIDLIIDHVDSVGRENIARRKDMP